VVWQGRAGDRSPYADLLKLLATNDCCPATALSSAFSLLPVKGGSVGTVDAGIGCGKLKLALKLNLMRSVSVGA
jgi:hypothetical protein